MSWRHLILKLRSLAPETNIADLSANLLVVKYHITKRWRISYTNETYGAFCREIFLDFELKPFKAGNSDTQIALWYYLDTVLRILRIKINCSALKWQETYIFIFLEHLSLNHTNLVISLVFFSCKCNKR